MQQVLLSKDAEMLLSTSKSVGTLSLTSKDANPSAFIFSPKIIKSICQAKERVKRKAKERRNTVTISWKKSPNEKNLSKPGAHLAKMKKM